MRIVIPIPIPSIRSLLFALVVLAMSATSFAQIGISVSFGPPALPVYEQPPRLSPLLALDTITLPGGENPTKARLLSEAQSSLLRSGHGREVALLSFTRPV
jgi:hypothetical protein